MEINISRLFSPWKSNEFERIVVSDLIEEKDAQPYISWLQKRIPKQQLKPGNLHFYGLKVVNIYEKELKMIEVLLAEQKANFERVDVIAFRVTLVSRVVLFGIAYRFSKGKIQKILWCASAAIPMAAYPFLKTYGKSYYLHGIPKTTRKGAPYDLILYRHQVKRVCPENVRLDEDRDPLTLDVISSEEFYSPCKIVLPNAVVDAKAFVRSCLEKGTLRHTLNNRDFNEVEYQNLMNQITQIFGISAVNLWSCFNDIFLEESDEEDYRGVDKNGHYTQVAREAIEYIFGEIPDSKLPEIDTYFDQIEQSLSPTATELCQHPAFLEFANRAGQEGKFSLEEMGDLIIQTGIPPINVIMIQISSEGSTPFPVVITSLLGLMIIEKNGPDWCKSQLRVKIIETMRNYKRMIRLQFLSHTLFDRDMRKKDRGSARIQRFEKLTGVSLSET